MIQIIGFTMCLYLVIKGCELIGSSAYRTENNWIKPSAGIAIFLCFFGALVFTFWLIGQGSAASSSILAS